MADGAAGDTMNTASRMESTCPPGLIQVSKSTWDLLRESDERIMDHPNGSGRGHSALVVTEESDWCPTGGVEVKGKGVLETYLWTPPEAFLQSPCNPAAFAKIVDVKKKKDPSRNPLTSLVNSMMNSKPLHPAHVDNPSSSLRRPDASLMVLGPTAWDRRHADSNGPLPKVESSGSNTAGGLVVPIMGNSGSLFHPLASQLVRTHSTPTLAPRVSSSPQADYGEFHHAVSLDVINSGAHANDLGISVALLQMCRMSMQGGTGSSINGSERGLAIDGSLPAMGSHYSGNLSAMSNILRGSVGSSGLQRRSTVAGPSGMQPVEEERVMERQGSKDSDEEMLDVLMTHESFSRLEKPRKL
jgi:hypothetical protein